MALSFVHFDRIWWCKSQHVRR